MTQDPTRRHVLTVWIGAVVVTILAPWVSDRIAGREGFTQGVASTPRSTWRLTGG